MGSAKGGNHRQGQKGLNTPGGRGLMGHQLVISQRGSLGSQSSMIRQMMLLISSYIMPSIFLELHSFLIIPLGIVHILSLRAPPARRARRSRPFSLQHGRSNNGFLGISQIRHVDIASSTAVVIVAQL